MLHVGQVMYSKIISKGKKFGPRVLAELCSFMFNVSSMRATARHTFRHYSVCPVLGPCVYSNRFCIKEPTQHHDIFLAFRNNCFLETAACDTGPQRLLTWTDAHIGIVDLICVP